ncbi:MAG TPA: chemotaxis protein CheA [Clostridia bacterium]|nr:chemotaxis protein CheA [Clostridia bacterium]
MSDLVNEMMDVYIDDMKEYLAILNGSIIALEKNPDEKTSINEMFRAYHTMKSSTAAMEFKGTADFIHRMEDLLYEIREGRLKVNPEIIKTLFESYDCLECFLNNVINDGREGELRYDGILATVSSHIDVENTTYKSSGQNAGSNTSINKAISNDGFLIKAEELERAEIEASNGRQIFRVSIVINKECPFKSVKAWMVFEDVARISAIIASDPVRPQTNDFQNGSFVYDGVEIRLVVASDILIDEFIQELCNSLNEIDRITIEEIKPGFSSETTFDQLQAKPGELRVFKKGTDESINDTVDEIIEGVGTKQHCPESSSASKDLPEIEIKIVDCELKLLELESVQYSTEGINELSGMLTAVYEIAADSGNKLLEDISRFAYNLAFSLAKEEISTDIVTIGLLADFLTFIKRLGKNNRLECDADFNAEVKSKQAMLKNYMDSAARSEVPGNDNKVKLGEILVRKGVMKEDDVKAVINLQKENYPDLKFGQIAIKENKAEVKEVINALHVQENAKTQSANQSYIRIPANKIDNLVDRLGELLITQSLHKQEIGNILEKEGGNLQNSIVRMERIAKELQDITMSLRMVSLKQTFQKIYRIGRDTAADLGKEVKIEVCGDETEIDRNVVDKIHDPLMHLMRNSISHGIEVREERVSKGKSEQGRIILQACNKRGIVYIEISDDGKGLSIDSIYKKALDKDLIDNTKKYSDEEIMKFIFLPGFSTAEKIDSISGRGVGLNVVQTEITKLGGKVDIENRPGNGCSFILKIPVNLATINGTVVEISGSKYVIPTLNIKQMLKPQEDQWVSIKGKTTGLIFRNEIIPIIPIDSILFTKMSNDELRSALVVVVEHEQKLMALPVRSIIGKQEVVVKQIGSDFSKLSYLSGATILGDGKVSLILDVEALYKFTDDTVKA